MNKYEQYKKVALPWLEEIPEHWELGRIGRIFNLRKEKNNPIITQEVLSLSAKYGVSPYSEKKEKGGNKPKEDIRNYNVCYPGDILVNCMNIVAGSVGISKYLGAVSPVYYPLVNQNFEQFSTRYMEYVLRTYNFQRSLVGLGKGIQMSESEDGRLFTVRMRISWDMLKTQLLPIPLLTEQEQIAAYLDWKISEIDQLILVEKEKIVQLENFKQKFIDSVINKLVDPSIPLREILSFGKGLSITKENLGANGTRCISYGEIHGGFRFSFISNDKRLKGLEKSANISISNSAVLEQGDFVFADTSEDLTGCGNFSFLEEKSTDVYAGYHTIVGKRNQDFNSKYLAYYFESEIWREQIRKQVKGVKVFSITQSILKATKVQIPNLKKQLEVVTTLDLFKENYENLLGIIQLKISNLEALKKSLISEVVTGKIDVRNVVVPSYEKVGIDVLTDEEEI